MKPIFSMSQKRSLSRDLAIPTECKSRFFQMYRANGSICGLLILVMTLIITFFCLYMESSAETQSTVPAFPGAEGYGAQSIGGRYGRVIEVTNLNDRGTGSFRAAVTAPGPRIVVFRVSGIIEVKSRIDIGHPYLTIAGQTAPGGGITLKGTIEGGGQMLRIRTHDVIIRYLRIRSGAHGKPGHGQINIVLDPLPARGDRYGDIYNIIIDHVSVSWTLDENISIHRNVPENDTSVWKNYPKIYNVSVQRCLVAEGLYPHSTGIQTGGERIARNGKSVYNGGHGVFNISIHRNMFANTSHRNPGLGCRSARVINNVMYNWSSKCAETHDAITVDWIGNYFKPGPLSDAQRLIVHNDFFKGYPQHRFGTPSIYMTGNVNASLPHQKERQMYRIHYEECPLPQEYWRSQPIQTATYPVEIQSATQAYQSVIDDVGADARLNDLGEWIINQDIVDERILNDVRNGTGEGVLKNGNRVHYMHPDQVGGYPTIVPGKPYEDSDHDGMSDNWEKMHGLDAHQTSDNSIDNDNDGYTNIEEFLNGTDPNVRESD